MLKLDSVPLSAVESKLELKVDKVFMSPAREARDSITEETWSNLINVIKELRSDLSSDIDRVISLGRYSDYHLTGPIADIFLQEREALGIALDIFSGNNRLRDSVLRQWAPDENTVTLIDEERRTARLDKAGSLFSFLDTIPHRYQEESAILHDLFNWEGMTPTHVSGFSVFEQGNRQLEVMYANRNSLERTLGVDLIYHSRKFDLFVLVQYKLMKKEGDIMVYRPDSQFREELARMDGICSPSEEKREIECHDQFRLNHDGFFFKLVPNQGLRPASGDLIQGMYLMREYMRFLVSAKGPRGSQGGCKITFAAAPRYLSNSEFAAGVNSGWLGTSGQQSQKIRDVMRQYYETGNGLLYARESIF